MHLRSASTQSRSSGMNRFFLTYMVSFPILNYILSSHKHKQLEEESFKNTFLRNYYARDSTLDGDHPTQKLVKGRRTVEDGLCSWCEFLSKKHEKCAKRNGSDDLVCNVFKKVWLKDCATSEGDHPTQKLVKGRRTVEDGLCSWCEFLSKKHEECAKRNGSDDLVCNVFKKVWLKDCATSEGKPKYVFVEGRSIV